MTAMLGMQGKYLLRTPEGQRFLHQSGTDSPKVGDRFVQAELAKTLRGVAKQGSKYMYTGPWGEQFVAAVRRDGGKVTMEDLKSYSPNWEEPLSTTFGDTTVVVPGKRNEGSHQVLEALNLIAELQLDQKGPYWKDAKVFRELSQVLQLVEVGPHVTPEVAAYQRKNGLAFSLEDRTTKAYAKAMAPLIRELQGPAPAPQSPNHSAGTVVIDRWGNVATVVHTIEGLPWGSTGIVVGGIPLSGAAGIARAQLAAIKPGDRLPGRATPMIVLTGNKPTLALATVGTSLLPETVRIVLGTVGNHLDLQTVVAAPPLLYNFEPPQAGETYTWKQQFVPEGAYDAEFLKELEASGVRLQRKPKTLALILRGTAALATIDARTGIRHSVEDPVIIDFADAY